MGDSRTPYDLGDDEDLSQLGEFKCNYCGEQSDTKTCKPCNSTRIRIHRSVRNNQQLANMWALVRHKDDLIMKAKGAYGDALFKLLKTMMVEEHSEKSEISFIGTGNWTDEPDLRNSSKIDRKGFLPSCRIRRDGLSPERGAYSSRR